MGRGVVGSPAFRTSLKADTATCKGGDMKTSVPESFEDYAAEFAPEVRSILRKVRATVRKAAPTAEERISYRMPAFKLHGDLVYFAAFKKHIGLYPPVRGDARLMNAVAVYAGPKGNLQFPLDEPIPYELIARIVKQRAKLNTQAAEAKLKKTRRMKH
jgi:uncharacterized protein YdhG (YjbR/CyaY superfamily)